MPCCGGAAAKDPDEGQPEARNPDDDEPEAKKTFAKGGDRDISNGPLKDRHCTDLWCLVVFFLAWVVYIVVTLASVNDGSPERLYRPRDFKGDYCGVAKQWNDGPDLYSHDKLTYMMNVTETVDLIAKQLICSTAAEDALSSMFSLAQMEEYRCACCKSPCRACTGALNMEDLTTTGALTSIVSGKMSELTDLSKASSLVSASGMNGDFFSSMWKEATKYFVPACSVDCHPQVFINLTRTYTYSPPPDVAWRKAWVALSTNPSTPQDIKSLVNDNFTFSALPFNACPYDAMYCVPFPGVELKEVGTMAASRCMFSLSSVAESSLGQSASEALMDIGMGNIDANIKEGLFSMAGDLYTTIDASIIVCIFAFVIGLVFLVCLRFLVGVAVWSSLVAVFVCFILGGVALMVRSGQCKGTTFFDAGTSTARAVAITAHNAAASAILDNVTNSEELLGVNGADYRGAQTLTVTGRTCQHWNSQFPHNHTMVPENHTGDGLIVNYCRNPNGTAPSIWCYTTDVEKRWELCHPLGVILPDCATGYEVSDETARDLMRVFAYISWVMAGVWLLLVLCLFSRIRLAVAINKVAARYVYNTPSIVLVPVFQILVQLVWCLLWALSASFLLSQVPDSYVPSGYFTYAEAYGTVDMMGQCTGKAPAGIVWKYQGNLSLTDDPCSGNLGDTSGITPRCWRCAPPRYVIDARLWVSFFVYLWNNAFMIALGQCIIAGSCAVWFFAPAGKKLRTPSVWIAIRRALRYHTGSLAFGSFIIAVVQLLRYMMKYLEKQAKAQKNRMMELVLKVVQCILWCFEKCLKFLNKNAYIQIAILGTNFCTSAKAAFFLIARNILRFGTVAALGSIIHLIGFCFIMIVTTLIGYLVLGAIHPDSASPVAPVCLYMAISYITAHLFMNVFGLAVDTIVQCYIAVEEMEGDADEMDFVPRELQQLLPQRVKGGQAKAMLAWA